MRTSVPRPAVLFALLFLFAAEHLTFLPAMRAQAAQAGVAVPVGPRAAGGRQFLRGHLPAVVAGLQPMGRLAATNRLNLAIGLPLRNQQALSQLLQQLSDPAHPNYRHYLTPEEFTARFGPTEQDYQAVIAFAQANGLTIAARHPNRMLLDVNGSVPDIEKALHVTMHVYQHPTEARTFYAPDTEASLDLAVPVLGISGLNNYALPRPRLQARVLVSGAGVSPANVSKGVFAHTAGGTPAPLLVQPNAGSGPSGTYMGGDFRAAYLPGVGLTGAGQVVGLLQFDGYTPSDITYYESRAGLPDVPLTNILLDGFTGNPTGSGGEIEVSLDIEMAISMAPGLAGVMVYMAGPYGNWHDILNRMATDNLAKQLSCSWYSPGGGPDPVADQIFQQMAAQGQSFFNASGDADAFSGPVDFPAETPYIVQVGGTTLTTSGPGGAWVSETVWNWGGGTGSGGGISTRYAIPSYQTDINMTLNQGSTTMRNIPDVALTADNVYVRVDGGDWDVGGTSCAAPLWAGFTALVNQQAVGRGRPVVGFVNPAVDAIGHAANYTTCFHDITTGNNTSPSSPSHFYAVTGYDLCTGWGTPAGQSLINALATPDPLFISPSALAFSGGVGGPFSPSPGWLTLTNTGTNKLSWTLVNTSAWFDVSPTSGTLLPGGAAASVSVSVDTSAGTFPAGVYAATLAFTNQTSGVGQSCSLVLSVAAPSMADDFDPGIDLTQWSGFGGVVGSSVLATNYGGSVSAPNSLWFGNAGSRYATTIPVNTGSGGQIGFCIRLANGTAWPWAIVDNLPADGVVLECSTNGGGSWTTIGNYNTPAYYNWTGVALPIPAVAQAPAALFRWRQLSNSGTNYEHWALDNVVIGTGSMAPEIVMDPQSQNVAVGDPASLSVAAVGTPPLSYQWLLNGTNISGATASSLVWTNVQLTDAGTYSVLVSNTLGAVMSSNAVLAVYVPVCAPPPDGLVSWWRGEGDTSDTLGAHDGTPGGGLSFAGGKAGQAFSFNGANAEVDFGNWFNLQTFSLAMWVKAGASQVTYADLIDNNHSDSPWRSWTVEYENTGLQFGWDLFNTGGGYTRIPFDLKTNTWQYLVLTLDSNRVAQVYLDGQVQGSATMSAAINYDGTQFLRLGRWGGGGRYFNGLMDEVDLYNRALAVSEIQALYQAGSAGKCVAATAPIITSQPANQTVFAGGAATFSVTAAGTPPLSYQWNFNSASLSGATTSSLALTNVQMGQAGTYTVLVSNSAGSILSSNAVLTVNNNPPSILSQPASQVAVAGSKVSFSVTAAGSPPLNYQWSFNGAALPGENSNLLTLISVQMTNAGIYAVLVSNSAGSILSSNAVLTVNPQPLCVPAPSGLVSWWRGEGDTSDTLGAHDGTPGGGLSFAGGKVGQAFSFNGANAEVDFGNWFNLQTFSLAMWVKAGASQVAYVDLIDNNHSDSPWRSWTVEYENTGLQFGWDLFNTGGGYTRIPFDLKTNTWQYLVLTLDSNRVAQVYLDGQVQGSATMSAAINYDGTQFLRLGRWGGGGRYFNGLMDEVDLYNRALAVSEIQALYQAGSAGKCGPGPVILTPPQSQTVECSSNANFSVSASGLAPLAYQWYFGANLIPGATNTVLTVTNVGFAQAGNYSVLITNAYGSATGGPALLTVVDTIPPTIISCASNQTLSVGANCTATLPDLTAEVVAWDASGPVTVTQNPPPGTQLGLGIANVAFTVRDSSGNASVCANSVTAVDTTPPFVLACVLQVTLGFDTNCQALLPDLTTTNYIIASDNCSSVTVTQAPPALTAMPVGTNAVLLTVSDTASNQTTRTVAVIVPGGPHIAVQPADLTLAVSSNATFSVLACGAAPLFCQWQYFSTNLPSATNAVLTLSNISTNDAGDYDVVITNSFGSITSAVARLTVLQPPVITSQPANQLAAPGCTVSFWAVATGTGPLIYQWQKDGLALDAQTNTTFILTNVQTSDFGAYALVVTNACGCVTSSNAVLSLDHPPVAGPVTIRRFAVGGVRVNAGVLLANDTDPDGDNLTIVGVSSNSTMGGTVSLIGSWVFYLPPPGYTNSDAFTYTVSDGHCGMTAQGTVTVQTKDTSSPWVISFIENPGDGSFRLTCDGVPGWAYKFQYAEDLPNPVWEDLTTVTADACGTCEYLDWPPTNAPTRFYRAVLP